MNTLVQILIIGLITLTQAKPIVNWDSTGESSDISSTQNHYQTYVPKNGVKEDNSKEKEALFKENKDNHAASENFKKAEIT